MQTLDRQLLEVISRLTHAARASKIVSINAALLAEQVQQGRERNTDAIKVVATEILRLSDESADGINALHTILADVKLLTHTINLAGRQRMLSQRLMKLVLIQCDRPTPERTQEIQELAEDFERTLERLKLCRLNTAPLAAQLDRATEAWRTFRTALGRQDIATAISLNERVLHEMHAAVQHYEELAGSRAAVA